MTPSIRDINYQLRQGQLIALADETGWSVAADPISDAAVETLLTLRPLMPADRSLTVLIHSADQLGMYVAKLPDIAYDLVEFAENPLVVVYEQGKNLSALLNDTPEIAVRRTLSDDIQRLISGFGRGLLTVPFESLNLPPLAELVVKERFGQLPGMPKRPRIMSLGVGGDVRFIRK